jgi:hypothetical protein
MGNQKGQRACNTREFVTTNGFVVLHSSRNFYKQPLHVQNLNKSLYSSFYFFDQLNEHERKCQR